MVPIDNSQSEQLKNGMGTRIVQVQLTKYVQCTSGSGEVKGRGFGAR